MIDTFGWKRYKRRIAGMPTAIILLPFYRRFYKKHFFSCFFTIFFPGNKADPVLNTIYSIGGLYMRMPRILAALAWYWVVTAVNRHEPLFLDRAAVDLFNRVLREAGKRFAIEVRHLVIEVDRVSFYIKPADGFMLPVVMQWIKQTFACRYNAMKRLDGHVWGDRYWSKVLIGEPPAEGTGRGDCVEGRAANAEEGGQIPKARPREGPPGGDSHREGETAENTRLQPLYSHHATR
jgi:REP element-mobilizing transposase RayT